MIAELRARPPPGARAARPSATSPPALPIAVLGVLAVLGLALGAALSVVGIGLPLLLGVGRGLPARSCAWTAARPTTSCTRRSRRCRGAAAHGQPVAALARRCSPTAALWRMVAVLAAQAP